MPTVTLRVNGLTHRLDVREGDLLLDVLRDELDCRSVREGCGVGACGSCTVLVRGRPVSSCLVLATRCDGAEVLTAEGLDPADPLVRAFVEAGAMQCGYCIPGFVLMVRDLLETVPNPTPEQVDEQLAGNICRCGTYPEIREAVRRVADAQGAPLP